MKYNSPGISINEPEIYGHNQEVFNGTGWIKESYSPHVNRVSVQHIENDFKNTHRDFNYEQSMKNMLIQQLAKEMFTKDLVIFRSSKSPMDFSTTHLAEINIVKPDIIGVHMDRHIYKVDNMDFTHEQIKEAVKNTFPEHWL